jgi:hypothetical protein
MNDVISDSGGSDSAQQMAAHAHTHTQTHTHTHKHTHRTEHDNPVVSAPDVQHNKHNAKTQQIPAPKHKTAKTTQSNTPQPVEERERTLLTECEDWGQRLEQHLLYIQHARTPEGGKAGKKEGRIDE